MQGTSLSFIYIFKGAVDMDNEQVKNISNDKYVIEITSVSDKTVIELIKELVASNLNG
jgi:hypothetical protein